jgi:hypothetical protein
MNYYIYENWQAALPISAAMQAHFCRPPVYDNGTVRSDMPLNASLTRRIRFDRIVITRT